MDFAEETLTSSSTKFARHTFSTCPIRRDRIRPRGKPTAKVYAMHIRTPVRKYSSVDTLVDRFCSSMLCPRNRLLPTSLLYLRTTRHNLRRVRIVGLALRAFIICARIRARSDHNTFAARPLIKSGVYNHSNTTAT